MATPSIPGEIIVGFKEGVSEAERNLVLAAVDAIEREEFKEIEAKLAEVNPDRVDKAIAELEDDPRVAYAEPNFLLFADDHPGTPNDPAFHELWGLNNFGQTVNGNTGIPDADIDAKEAWASPGGTTGSADVLVGVIDSGVDFGHPDLGGSREASPLMWLNPGENCPGCRTNGVDDDANGYVDDWRGWDFVNDDNDPFDDNGHGTHVAGTIGAIGNDARGVVGVNWSVKIMALKFLSAAGSGSTANAVKAVLYASAKGARVTNNSWGGGRFSQALLDAIREADARGTLFVAAAGNGGPDGIGDDTDASPHFPSSYDVPNVMSVAATDASDAKTPFSNFGRRSVDLGAPGANIYSSFSDGSYRYASGTSMATAHASGAAALAAAAFGSAAGHLGIKALLLGTVDPTSSLNGKTATGGRLNVDRAVRCADAPKVWIEAPGPGFVVSTGEALAVRVIGATCANPGGVTVRATANGSPIALAARGDGLYSGTYTPTVAGPVEIRASATAGADTDTRTVSGTAVQNYRFEDAPFAWIDATAGGTNAGISDDDTSVTVALSFPFSFYGEPFTSVRISSNGYLVFGPSQATAFSNVAIPNANAPNGLVAPLWDDLDPSAGGAVWYRTVGTAPNRRFVVAWVAVPRRLASGTGTLEVVLEEGTNDILFQYQDVTFGNASYDFGASATVGVENPDGTIGKQFSHNQAALEPYENTKALRFTTRPGVTITTTALADGTVGRAYSQTLEASGGTTPYRWRLASGALPLGLTLNGETGEISGTPTPAGSYSFTAEVTDSSTPPQTAPQPLTIAIEAALGITTRTLANGIVGQAYRQTLQATGGTTPYSWSIATGSLPPGLSLDAATGTIAGTPTAAGTYGFTAEVTDSSVPPETATRPLAIRITTEAPRNYRFEDAPFAWIDATAGGTNTGITRDDSSAPVELPFTFTFYDQPFTSATVSSNGYLVFGSSPATRALNVALPNANEPNGLVAAFWDDLNPAAGGSIWYRTVGTAPNRRFVVAWVAVPHYLNVGNATLEIVLEEGTSDILFQYEDVTFGNASYDHGASATVGLENLDGTIGKQFSHNQAALQPYENARAIRFTRAAGLTVTTTALADGTVGQAYSQTLEASGGTTPYTWEIAVGSLPPGLSLTASTGTIAGTPTTAGTYSFTARVTDSTTPAETATQALTITIASGLAITTRSLPEGAVGRAYRQTLGASGGTTPYRWAIAAGSLPPGLSLSASAGTIAGTPTSAGSYSFTAEVTDSSAPPERATQPLALTIAVGVALRITTTTLPDGTVDRSYSYTLRASGGTTPYRWEIAAGSLPPALNLSASTGRIAGTPTSAGTYSFTAEVSDSSTPADSATQELSLTVASAPFAPPLTSASLGVAGARMGTRGAEVLTGTSGDEVFRALGGDDMILGRAGRDVVYGGAGNDVVRGGRGEDVAYGERGNDLLFGEVDDDLLDGGPGRDLLWGGPGNDVLQASDGSRDTINCGSGSDIVVADSRDRVGRDCEVVRRR